MDNLRRKLLASLEEPGLPAGTVFNYAYTGSVQSVELPKGKYQLQCWGAQGGTSKKYGSTINSTYAGGKGGYSIGVLTLTQLTTLYVFVGGCPSSGSSNGGWNCGGGGEHQLYLSNSVVERGCGGGATDIALVTSSMSYSDYINNRSNASLLSRIIVAGGGSGGYGYWGRPSSGSTGRSGGQEGVYGGGTQGGGASSIAGKLNAAGYNASFGKGGNGGEEEDLSYSDTTYGGVLGFGGAGWYGGGTRYLELNYVSNGYGYYTRGSNASGGGSGFVNTYANRSYRPSGYTGLQLDSGTTYAGTSSFVQPEGGSAIGRSGNGYARITVL